MVKVPEALTETDQKWKLLPLPGQTVLARVCQLKKKPGFHAFSVGTAAITDTQNRERNSTLRS